MMAADAALEAELLKEDPDLFTAAERFERRHTCRTAERPRPLADAYESAAASGSWWCGADRVRGWRAVAPSETARRMPSTMILRGEHDFVTADCADGWRDAFNHDFVRYKVLEGASHHGLLENGEAYGEIIDSYFAEYD